MSQAGNIGGYALADVLTGKVTPSGHLTTTWAKNYPDYPGAEMFGHRNGDVDDEYYKEGIFVGYRYFDTFGVAPAYPFGYGISYTDFQMEVQNVTADAGSVSVTVKVTNAGDAYAGKEVVQVYYSAPDGKLEKPYQELAAYAKTRELQPGRARYSRFLSGRKRWLLTIQSGQPMYWKQEIIISGLETIPEIQGLRRQFAWTRTR